MKKSREEKRERLKAKAEETIDANLEWEEKNPQSDLTGIEEIALKLRKEFGQEIAQITIEGQAEQQPAIGPKCEKCGKEMQYKGKKASQVESRTGQHPHRAIDTWRHDS